MASLLQQEAAGRDAQYKLERVIGRGAFGEVLLGVHRVTGEQVAVKLLYAASSDDQLPAAVAREVQALQSMQCLAHPNVVALKDVYCTEGCVHIVQEYCTTDLVKLLDACYAPVPAAIAKALVQQMLFGMQACHAAGFMHRDLKPSNLLLSADGHLKIADFGMACVVSSDESARYSHAVASRWYRAPELLYGANSYGPAVDVWGAGMVFAEILGLGPLVPGDSDIGQLARLQQTLGSIELSEWPQAADLPDWGKICFAACGGTPLGRLLPGAPLDAIDLLGTMLRYPPQQRPTASQALQHAYFGNDPLPADTAAVVKYIGGVLQRHAAVEARLAQRLPNTGVTTEAQHACGSAAGAGDLV